MRPDDHKKKKSAQYQKKHGAKKASSLKSKDKSVDQTQKNPKHKTAGGRATHFDKNEGATGGKNKTLSPSDSETSDSDVEIPTQKKTFQRRKIVSNWDKYELAPDKDDIETNPKGEDFSKLLGMAGGALSQFRFKDEEEWEEDVTAKSSDFLAVDCDELASALDCLPVHKRLGLETELFSEKQISEMNTDAEAKKEAYRPQQRRTCKGETTVTANPLVDTEEIPETSNIDKEQSPQANNLSSCLKQIVGDEAEKSQTVHNLEKTDKVKVDSSDDVTEIEINENSSTKLTDQRKDSTSDIPDSKTSQTEDSQSNQNAVEPKQKPESRVKKISVGEQEEELDFLLSLDNPDTEDSDGTTETEKKGGVTKTFLGGKTFTDTTTTVSQASRVKKEKSASIASQDLEDWLNSILDD